MCVNNKWQKVETSYSSRVPWHLSSFSRQKLTLCYNFIRNTIKQININYVDRRASSFWQLFRGFSFPSSDFSSCSSSSPSDSPHQLCQTPPLIDKLPIIFLSRVRRGRQRRCRSSSSCLRIEPFVRPSISVFVACCCCGVASGKLFFPEFYAISVTNSCQLASTRNV